MSYNLNDREAALVRLWNDNLTQREIAEELEISIGMVSGLASRLKARGVIQPKTPEQVVKACLRAASKPAKAKKTVSPPKIVETLPVIAAEPPKPVQRIVDIPDEQRIGIDIMRLTKKTCHWVLPHRSAEGLPLYCGGAVDHRSFCQCHAARAFHIPNDWRPATPGFRRLKLLLALAGR